MKLCGWILRQARSTEDEGGDYSYKDLHDDSKLIMWK